MAQRYEMQGINRSAKTKQAASWLPAQFVCITSVNRSYKAIRMSIV